jgi:hypothetical protein
MEEKWLSAKTSFTTALRAQTSYRHGVNCSGFRSHAMCTGRVLIARVARTRLPCAENPVSGICPACIKSFTTALHALSPWRQLLSLPIPCHVHWPRPYCSLRIKILTSGCWGMSRRGRRDVEEGIVRVEHSGVFGAHEHRLEVRDKRSENSRRMMLFIGT